MQVKIPDECQAADDVLKKARAVADKRRIDVKTITVHSLNPTAKEIIGLVADFYEVSELEITSRRRQPEVVMARWMAWFLMREYTRLSYPQMGWALRHFDHSAPLRAVKKFTKQLSENELLRDDLDVMRAKINHLRDHRRLGRTGTCAT